MSGIRIASGLLAGALAATGTQAQEPELGKKVQELQEQFRRMQQDTDEGFEDLETRLGETTRKAEAASPGTTGFLISGYAFAGFTESDEENSTFNAGFNPVFLWRLSDRLFFESELELELEDRETEVGLEYAQLTFVVHDYVAVGAGKFLVPFAQFGERLHPPWINKLPDAPLFWRHHGGFAPMTEVGLQARGGAPLAHDAKVNYAVYVTNGPELLTTGGEAGELRFGSAEDNNNNKAVGGRLGILPVPELEVGLSAMFGRAGDSGDPTSNVDALLWAVDLAWVHPSELLKGTTDVRFEWVRSDVDAHPSLVGGQDNERDGWYVQVAHRPDKLDSFLRDCEFVLRYDEVEVPSSLNEDRRRLTFGLDYWLSPSTVGKLAYQIDDRDGPADDDVFFLQFAMGF